MSASLCCAAFLALFSATTISGRVVDPAGAPVPDARVFIEPGLAGALQEAATDAQGQFQFTDVVPGSVGVFAYKEGYAYGGQHLNLTPGLEGPPVTVQLFPPTTVNGKVVNAKGKPVSGARVTRIALQEQKVGIPLAKLKALGFEEPVTNEDGAFTIAHVPQGGQIALKVGHPLYAQEAVSGVSAGDKPVKVTLYEGVLVEGIVLTRGGETAIAKATVVITSAQPPQDSALTFTDTQGKFSIRLKPGNYIYRATAIGWQSPGWTDLSVTGNGPLARTRLIVSRTGSIQGTVKDAKTGQGIVGARLSLECNGNAAAVVRTGAGGEYSVEAVEGDNVLRLESAPGYLPPAEGPIRITLHEAEAKTLPDLWLLPLPVWRVQVLGPGGQPAPGAIVSLLRPAQVGWRVTGPEGWVELDVENVPPDGKIVGLAEAIQEPLGALFQVAASQGEPGPVQLLPLGTVRGRVVDKEGNALEGAAVGAVFPGETAAEELMLWRSISGDEGAFVWESVVPGVPQLCIARAGAAPQAQSPPFNLAPGTSHDLGALTLAEGQKEKTLYGRPLAWRELPVVAGVLPPERELRGRPALVIYCDAAETEAVLAALALPAFQDLVQESPLITAVVTSVPAGPGAAPCVVLRGAAPTHATTYLCDASGNVVLQTFGMPPLRGLQKLLVESKSVGSD